MRDTTFRFKQFSVSQGKCAMKVNTDGVLLGAWANTDNALNILDIGTGTGVIALMMAQKNTDANIYAIDIDNDAYLQATENFEQSIWRKRLKAFCTPLQEFNPAIKYDLIISNPPYFINDYKTDSHQKNIARHTVTLSYEELLFGIARLLNISGKALLVIPVFNLAVAEAICNRHKLYITQLAEVFAIERKQPYLVLLQIERNAKEVCREKISIHDATGNFTNQYKTLTKDFYLKF